MGKTKKNQFLLGLIIGISVWVAGIIITGFLPTFGDGIEFGYRSALPIIFPAVMWVVSVFFGIKTAKRAAMQAKRHVQINGAACGVFGGRGGLRPRFLRVRRRRVPVAAEILRVIEMLFFFKPRNHVCRSFGKKKI